MLVHQLEQLACRAIVGNRVRRRADAVEGVLALRISLEFAAEVMLGLLVVLLLVQTFGAVLVRAFAFSCAGA